MTIPTPRPVVRRVAPVVAVRRIEYGFHEARCDECGHLAVDSMFLTVEWVAKAHYASHLAGVLG